MLRALAHPARRQILRLTGKAAVAAGDLAASLGLANATVSEHLKVLRKTRLVTMSVDGTWRRYRADLGRLDEIRAWIDGFDDQKETP